MARKFPDEWYEQAAVIEWIERQHPWLINHTIYIMADTKCSLYVGNMLNKMGRRKGRSDLFFAYPTTKFRGLFIEMKTATGRLSKEQKEFLERMNMFGYYATAAYGTEEAIAIIKGYLSDTLLTK